MRRIPALLLTLFLALNAFALADLSVVLDSTPAVLHPGQSWTVSGSVTNNGPHAASTVRVNLVAGQGCDQEVLATLEPGETRRFTCNGKVQEQLMYGAIAGIQAYAADGDPDQTNNYAQKIVRVDTPPDLFVYGQPLDGAKPGLPFPFQIYYGNRAFTTATNGRIAIVTPTRVTKAPDFCTIADDGAICNLAEIAPSTYPGIFETKWFPIEVVAPDASAQEFNVVLSIHVDEGDAFDRDNGQTATMRTYRTFTVTNVNDSGSGSLRAAMDAAHAECTDTIPCLVAFRIPPNGANAWHTIALQSPLPFIQRSIFIDGTTQTGYFGDTNAEGPEVEISGSEVPDSNGFVFECLGEVRGLTINGFAGNGVLATGNCDLQYGIRAVRGNYIGTDPTGTHAVPNGRGVRVSGSHWLIENNVISGNWRSGVFVDAGITNISKNKIGVTPSIQPLGNGASGVFIGVQGSGSDVSNNYIGFNRDFGVAIAGDATSVSADHNSMQGNFQHGIDWGLDGVITPNPVPLPEITSVRFEDGKTIVEGTSTAYSTFNPSVTIYANDAPDPSGYGEGQYVLGDASVVYNPPALFRFNFMYAGDLRGKWITATATRRYYNGWLRQAPVDGNGDTGWGLYTTTSEFSRAVEVK